MGWSDDPQSLTVIVVRASNEAEITLSYLGTGTQAKKNKKKMGAR
jgi:hypothetical protein